MSNNQMTRSYWLLWSAFRLLFRLLTRIEFKGLENTPMEGPLLIAANHNSLFEGPLILAFLPRQPMSAMAKMEYKSSPIGRLIDIIDPVYVARGEVDRVALKETLKKLKAGSAIGIAPEGTRSRDGTLLEGKEGTSYLAVQTGAWVLPVAVWGQEKAVAEWKRFRRPLIHMHVGEPFKLETEPSKSRNENMQAGTERIMHALARLLPPEYRGFYAKAVQG